MHIIGHLAIQFAAALNAKVAAVSTSGSKQDDARKLGASEFIISTDKAAMKKVAATFDLVVFDNK